MGLALAKTTMQDAKRMTKPPGRPSTPQIRAARHARMIAQGEFLRPLRKAAGLTQAELGKALGLPNDTMIQHWENGRNWVDLKHYEALAQALNQDVTEFSTKLRIIQDPSLATVLVQPTKARTAAVVRLAQTLLRAEHDAIAAMPRGPKGSEDP